MVVLCDELPQPHRMHCSLAHGQHRHGEVDCYLVEVRDLGVQWEGRDEGPDHVEKRVTEEVGGFRVLDEFE